MPRRSLKGVGHRCVAMLPQEDGTESQCDGLTDVDHVRHPADNKYTSRDRICRKCGTVQTTLEKTVVSSCRRKSLHGIYTTDIRVISVISNQTASLFD